MATAEKTARIKAINKANKRERGAWRSIKGVWPLEDEAYLDWIRSLPCVICYSKRAGFAAWVAAIVDYVSYLAGPVYVNRNGFGTQAAHVGARGLRQKCSDRETAPLCGVHHDRGQPEGHHDLGKNFWSHHEIDVDQVVLEANSAYGRLAA